MYKNNTIAVGGYYVRKLIRYLANPQSPGFQLLANSSQWHSAYRQTIMSDKSGKELSRFDNDEHNMSIVDEAFNVPGYDPSLQFEPGEARKALLKVDLLILPPTALCFYFLQFDRTNIGNVLTDSLRKDMGCRKHNKSI
ncbi:hypothetical protein MY11210_007093 [Beauveria gryllotalpidicola]